MVRILLLPIEYKHEGERRRYAEMVHLMVLGFCLVLCLSAGFLRFCLLVVTVTGQSMAPVLQEGDRLLVWQRWPARWFRRGQIVVFHQGELVQSERETLHIKRLVALPGEAFTARPPTIRSALDDQLIEEVDQVEQTWQIPPGYVFVCGDHREQSVDSRIWGPLPQHQVRGVVLMKLARLASTTSQIVPGKRAVPKWGLPRDSVAPAFSASTLDGSTVTSRQYRGQALLLFFISAHPSSPMRSLLSCFETIASRATEAGVAVFFISASPAEETRRLAQAMPNLEPLLLAHWTQNTLLHDFEVEGMPCYCLIDQAGIVCAAGIPLGVLETELDRLALKLARPRREQQTVER
jgi:signal peptidase I